MSNFVIGKIVNMHGIKGELKVYPETDEPEILNDCEYVFIKGNKYNVESSRMHKGCILLKVSGIDSINDGERLKNEYVEIPEEFASPCEEGEYFLRDILDCKVYDEDDNYIGIVCDVMFTLANDVYVVKDDAGKEVLLPNIDDCIKEVDIENKKIKIHVMEGLID